MKYAVLTLLMALLLAGCGEKPLQTQTDPPASAQSPVIQTDLPSADNRFALVGGFSLVETDDYFCGNLMADSFLRYFDKDSGISGILCADPSCTHDSPSCGAYAKPGSLLAIRDGKRYAIAEDPDKPGADFYLWESDLSGNNRKRGKQISFEDVILPYQPQQYALHQGRLYFLGQAGVVLDGKSGYRVSLLSTSVDGSDDFLVLYDESVTTGIQPTVRYGKDAIYLSVVTFEDTGLFHVKILKLDPGTGASETVYAESDMTEAPGSIWVTDDGTVCLPAANDDHSVVWDVTDGTKKEIFVRENAHAVIPELSENLILMMGNTENGRQAEVLDLDGNSLYRGALFPEPIPGLSGDPNSAGLGFLGGDSEKLVFSLMQMTDSDFWDAVVLLDLQNNLAPTVLWSSIDSSEG